MAGLRDYLIDAVVQRVPEPLTQRLPTAGRTFIESMQGRREPITEQNFTPDERRLMRQLVESKGAPEGAVTYEDYYKHAQGLRNQNQHVSSTMPSVFSLGDAYGNVQTTLGQFRYKKGKNGNIQVSDNYDFNPHSHGGATSEAVAATGPYNALRMYAGEKMPPGTGRAVRLNLPPTE